MIPMPIPGPVPATAGDDARQALIRMPMMPRRRSIDRAISVQRGDACR